MGLHRFLIILLPLFLGACAGDAVKNARALGDRVEDRVRLNLDTRADFYQAELDAAQQMCELYQDAADVKRMMCLRNGGCEIRDIAEAYKLARDCWRDEAPSIIGIRKYREELRGAFGD